MDFVERVAVEYRKRLSEGINRERACNFKFSDFPGVPDDVFNDFCHRGYAKRFTRSFALTRDTMDEFEE